MTSEQNKDNYLNTSKEYSVLVAKEEHFLLLLSILRLICFLGGVVSVWLAFTQSNLAGAISLLVMTALFLYLIKLYWQHGEKREFFNNLVLINQREANAVTGNFTGFDTGNSYLNINHDFSNDVDLFGESSIFQYLNRTVTGYGSDILAGWLSDPYAISAELLSRQEIIRELSIKKKWRHEFMALGMKCPLEKINITGLLEWMKENSEIQSSAFKKVLIYLLPLAAITSLVLMLTGILQYTLFTLIFLLNLFYITSGLKKTNRIHKVLTRKYEFISSMQLLLKSFEKESFTSKGLVDIKVNISGRKFSASNSVKKLGRLIQSFDSRLNLLVGFVLNGLLLWDYHCIYRLEKWKSEYKDLLPVWLEMIGKVDAFVSLGNYAYNNLNFAYPEIAESLTLFDAKMLGHQLIDEKKRVCNDFTLDDRGTVCIISGANMAGKSTFLRTIAINYILAMAGAPVCAKEMSFVPSKIFTSMRTIDSLSNNESYFYAELKRLKTLKSRVEDREPIFFILDEILKGTNSADKSLGSKLFIETLVRLKGTGLIATHDTSLGDLRTITPE